MSQYIAIILGILLITFYITAIVTAFLMGRRTLMPLVAAPCCPVCRTSASYMNNMHCPSCKSDLREVGLSVPNMRYRVSYWWGVLIWSLFYAIPSYLIVMLLLQFVAPTLNAASYTVNFSSYSPEVKSTSVHAEFRGASHWPWNDQSDGIHVVGQDGITSGIITITILRNWQYKPAGIITVDAVTRDWQLASQDGSILKGQKQFDRSSLQQCLIKLQIKRQDDPNWDLITDTVLKTADNPEFSNISQPSPATPGWPTPSTSPYTTWTESPTYAIWFTISLAILIYILGLILIHRWTKREKAALAVTTSYKIQQ